MAAWSVGLGAGVCVSLHRPALTPEDGTEENMLCVYSLVCKTCLFSIMDQHIYYFYKFIFTFLMIDFEDSCLKNVMQPAESYISL